MACTYSHSTKEQFQQDLQELHKNPTLLDETQVRSKSNSIEKSNVVLKLNRGGIIIKTNVGPVQFGLPPETVKDSMQLGIEVPTYYIIPTDRFDKKFGINVAEFEFPAYFNFFIKRRQVTLVCDQTTADAIKVVFQETLLGPADFSFIAHDYHPDVDPAEYVDFEKELSIFAKNPMNPQEKLTIDTLLKFEIFKDNQATIQVGENKLTIQKGSGEFTLYENGNLLLSFPDKVNFPKDYQKYIEIHKPDQEWRKERVPPSVQVIKNMKDGLKPPSLTQTFDEDEGTPGITCEPPPRPQMLMWNQQGQAKVNTGSSTSIDEQLTFSPPDFGVTVLGCVFLFLINRQSHGFDPKGSTSGYIFWINGRGVMVDPPPYTSYHLKQMGIPPVMVRAIIISHCHADHDAGAFHKILDDTKVEIITTRTIMYSFLRKYAAISGMPVELLKSLFVFRPAIIGCPLSIYGASFQFFYALHSIPSLGFKIKFQEKSIFFSADTYYDPAKIKEYQQKGFISERRMKQLTSHKLTEDIILHEAGVPPIHTPQAVLAELPSQVKNRLYLVHVAAKDIIKGSGLKVAKAGIENTLILIRPNISNEISWARKMDLISKIDIFDKLTINNAKWLMDALVLEYFKEGELVIEENKEGNKFYIIESGLAKVFSQSKDNQFERYLQVGDYFGESALIMEGKRKASVVAVTDIRLLSLEKHDFWFIFGDGFEGSGPVIQQMMHLMEARKLQAIHILFKNSQCSRLTPSQKTQLEMIMHEQSVVKGQILWKVGDEPNFGFFIRRGCFEFVDCPEMNLQEFDSGAFIGEIKALTEGSKLTTAIKSCRDGSIFVVNRNDLCQFLNRNPGLMLLFKDTKYIE